MNIILKPGEILTNVKGTQDKPIIVLFNYDWDFGHMMQVNNLIHVTKYKRGEKRAFEAKSFINMANGGMSVMDIEIITVN